MNLNIRSTKPEDIAAIVKLMREFAEYEKLAEYCVITEERLHGVMFGNDAFVESLMAFEEGVPVAYALFYPSFASFRGERGLYLEDIFITREYRGKGVGEALLKEIARLGHARGSERIDFQVLEWNEPAINFYEKHAAVRNHEERHFKFSGEAFRRLAS